MTEHLPECNYEKNPERNACICQRLRACEERMLTTYLARDNFEAGLDAAREAVAALQKGGMGQRAHELWRNALTAIDALREKKP
jgi:hypothetical protein